jgi:hypothetical protein
MHGNGKTRRNEAYKKQVRENTAALNQHQPVDMSIEDMIAWALKQREEA